MAAAGPDDDAGPTWAPFGSYADDQADLPPLPPLPDEGPAATLPGLPAAPAVADVEVPAPPPVTELPSWQDFVPQRPQDDEPAPLPPEVEPGWREDAADEPIRRAAAPDRRPPERLASAAADAAEPAPSAPPATFWRWEAPATGQDASAAGTAPTPAARGTTAEAAAAGWSTPQAPATGGRRTRRASSAATTDTTPAVTDEGRGTPRGGTALTLALVSYVFLGFLLAVIAIVVASGSLRRRHPGGDRALAQLAIGVAAVRLVLSVVGVSVWTLLNG